MEQEITLSTVDLQVISELDSRLFGFVKLNEEAHANKKAVAIKAIKYLERVIVQAGQQFNTESILNIKQFSLQISALGNSRVQSIFSIPLATNIS